MKPVLLAALIGFSLVQLSCTKNTGAQIEVSAKKLDDSKLQLSTDALKNLKIEKIHISEVPEKLDVMGKISVTEDRTINVPSRVSGRIDSILIASGETVYKGQTIARLFSPDFISAREEYLQSLRQTRKVTNGESSDFGTFSKLSRKKLETMGLSPDDIEELSRTPDSTEDDKRPLLTIRAPRAGVIITKNAVLGNLVNVGDSLFTVADLSKVWFSGDVYTEDLQKVRKDQEIIVDSVAGSQPFVGKISFISPMVDANARTIKIRALIENPGSLLRADMYIHGALTLKKTESLVIPTRAIIRNGNTESVFRRFEENKVEKVLVATAGDTNGSTRVASGLKDGDEVVTDGTLFLEAAINSGN